MLQAFIDDSGWDGQSPVFVLAGYVAQEKVWEQFSDDWQAVLDLKEPRPLEFLKMNEAYLLRNRNSQFYGWTDAERDERLKKLIRVTNKHAAHGVISVVPIEAYRRHFSGKFKLEALDRPYFLSFFGMMTRLIALTKQLKLDDKIDIIFDSLGGESKAMLVREYERYINLAPAEFRAIGPVIPKFEREQEFKPLQAADMLAWHARRYYFEEAKGRDPLKHPSNVFFAHMFYSDHDLIDIWDDERLKKAADVLLGAQGAKRNGLAGSRMTLPDPSNPLNWSSEKKLPS